MVLLVIIRAASFIHIVAFQLASQV